MKVTMFEHRSSFDIRGVVQRGNQRHQRVTYNTFLL
jgi:hypothetical protein